MRNCTNQLVAEPSVASTVFGYRFSGNDELPGHNLGNLMLKALDYLSVWPLETINSIRNLLKVGTSLIPTSERPVDLTALDHEGHEVYGEVNIGQLDSLPQELTLTLPVPTTREVVEAIVGADLIFIDPGSFHTSLLPILLLNEMTQALRRTPAPMVLIDNLGKEHNPAARSPLAERTTIVEHYVGKRVVDAVIVGPKADIRGINDRLVIQTSLEVSNMPRRHGRALLCDALEEAIQLPG